jgi:hypothetical protein
MRLIRALLVVGAALTVAGLLSCGGNGNPTQPPANPRTTMTTTTTLPPSSGFHCSPSPPPLYGISIKIQDQGDGYHRQLDSRPWVINVDGYCEKHTGRGGAYCRTAREGDPDMADCDKMAVGQATNTGRWGPTWKRNGKLCVAGEDPGCRNNPNNQFLLNTKGDGVFEACANPSIPLSQDPNHPGARCGRCVLSGTACN